MAIGLVRKATRPVSVWTRSHAQTPKPYCPLAESVLRDRALAQLNSGQRSEHDGNPPHRYAHSIVEHVSRSHHSFSHPMGARTVLVRPNIPMTPSTRLPHDTHRHTCTRYRSGHRGNVGHVRKALSLMFEYASTSGAAFRSATSTGGAVSSSTAGGFL